MIASIINAMPNRKLLNYSYIDQVKDILPSILLSLLMAVIIYPLTFLIHSNFLLLFVQCIFGGVIYIWGSWILKFEPFLYCLKIVRPLVNRVIRKDGANNENQVSD